MTGSYGPRRGQGGQAMVFVVMMMVAVLLSVIFLFKAGRLTIEKMKLQNAADAAAFSVSTVESRDLNFAAYTNRAMVANEVGIGQLVGLNSWAREFKSTAHYLKFYDRAFLAGPTLGLSSLALAAPIAIWKGFGLLAIGTTSALAKFGSIGLSSVNKVYSLAQTAYHGATVALALGTISEMVEQNDPDANLSDYGFWSLVGHLKTYSDGFTKTYKSNKRADGIGMERLAATIRTSRDPFSKHRSWNLPLFPPIHVGDSFNFGIGEVGAKLDVEISLQRAGGSELRYRRNPKGENFGWSGGDTMSLEAWLGVAAWVSVGICPVCATVRGGIELKGGYLSVDAPWPLSEILPSSVPFPTGAPFGTGGVQVAGSDGKQTFMSMRSRNGRPVPDDAYGGAPRHRLAYNGLIAPPRYLGGVRRQVHKNNLNEKYGGLPTYTDTDTRITKKKNVWGFEAPYLIIGLKKDLWRIDLKGVKTKGELELEEAAPDKELTAMARSEVYFSRPKDLGYFARTDGQEEYGSTFNPYWQARLVDTSYADRVVAMMSEQGQVWQRGTTADEAPRAPNILGIMQAAGL